MHIYIYACMHIYICMPLDNVFINYDYMTIPVSLLVKVTEHL